MLRGYLCHPEKQTVGSVVQLVRMPPCHGGGRGFESRPVRKSFTYMVRLLFFMAYFVYIIRSNVDDTYYKGFSENPLNRLLQHNNCESHFTSAKVPWQLVFVQELPSKKDALIREKALKKYSHAQIKILITSTKNIVHQI